MIKHRSSNRVPDDGAARWAARLADSSAPLHPREQAEMEAWYRASPANAAALDRYLALWDDPALLAAMRQTGPGGASPSLDRPALDRRRLLAGAGGLAALTAIAWLARAPFNRALADAATAPGEIRSLPPLPGGGRLLLDTASAVDLPEDGRRVHLKAGALQLDLSGSDALPLTAGRLTGQADAGSLLTLRRDGDADRLAVLRGRVDLRETGQSVQAGEALTWPDDPPRLRPHALTRAERDAAEGFADAWRLYERAPLADLASELGRYLPGRLLVDSAVAGLLVSGRFRFADPERVLGLLAATLPVRIGRLGSLLVRLSEKN